MNTEAQILEKIMKARKSVFPKEYSNEEIPHEVLIKILASAEYTPNHKKTRPWRFRLFQGEEKNQLGVAMAELYKEVTDPKKFKDKKYDSIAKKIHAADAIISLSTRFSGKIPEWEELAATAMAVQNMYLTCTAYGVGCYWSSPALVQHLHDFLELKKSERCYGLFYMGIK